MVSRAAARCMAFLDASEGLCQETDALRLRIETTQSALWPEVFELLGLFSDLDRVIAALKRFNEMPTS